jgi:hypothetical protein
MATKGYEVLGDQVTVHRQVGELRDPISKEVTGVQNGMGRTYYKGEVIPADAVSPDVIAALEDEDHPSHAHVSALLSETSDEPRENTAERLGVPFADYDSMSEEDILGSMRFLHSGAVAAIKRYERENEGRSSIVNFQTGHGVDPDAYAEDRVGGGLNEEAGSEGKKKVSKLKTRAVPDEGPVEQGDGVTGIGVGQRSEGKEPTEHSDEAKSGGTRRRRRTRQTKPSGGESSGSGGDSSE